MPTRKERNSYTNEGPGIAWLLHHDGICLGADGKEEVWRYLLMHLREMSGQEKKAAVERVSRSEKGQR